MRKLLPQRLRLLFLFAAAVLILSPASTARAAADVWDGNGASPPNGIWGTGANWGDNTIPGNGDTATFNIANTYNVTFNAAPAAIQALTTSSGNVTFASSGGAQTLAVNSASGGQDVTVNGGATLSLGTSGNPVHLSVGDDLAVNFGGTLNVNFGSDVSTLDLVLGGATASTIVVDGIGSSLNRTGTTNGVVAATNGTGGLTYRNGATGDINGQLTVQLAPAGAGTAILNVESDADLMLDSLLLGGAAGAGPTGAVTVTGVGSVIAQTGASTLTVGRPTAGENIGILNVNSGGTFATGTGAVALNTTGTISVAGGTLYANGALTMSAGSTLTLNGGTLNASAGFNNAAGGTLNFFNGELVINGGSFVPHAGGTFSLAGSSPSDVPHLRLTNGAIYSAPANNLVVGTARQAVLTIEDDAEAHANDLTISSNGTVNLDGGTLRFNTASGLDRVNFNAGTIKLAGNRTLGTDPAITALFGLLPVGVFIDLDRSLFVEGDVSVDVDTYVFRSSLTVGGNFSIHNTTTVPHFLVVDQDGTVTSDAGLINSNNYVLVQGENALWTTHGILLGLAGSPGHLRITDQGKVDVFELSIHHQDCTVTLDGGTLKIEIYTNIAGGTFNFISGTIDFGTISDLGGLSMDSDVREFFGDFVVIPDGKGLAATDGPTTSFGAPVILDGGTLTLSRIRSAAPHLILNRGTFNVLSQNLVVGPVTTPDGTIGEVLDLGPDTTVNSTLGVTNNGLVTGDGQIGGTFTNTAAGELRGEPGKSLKLTGANNTNAGQINLYGGMVEFTQNLTNNVGAFISGNGTIKATTGITNNGTMNFSGLANIVGDVTNSATGKIISSGGGPTTFHDDVTNQAGSEIRTSNGSFTVFFGAVTGTTNYTGTGTVNFEGDLKPGSSPAQINFPGNVVFGPAATLEIELGGTTPGTQHDKLNVAGNLVLDGALNVSLINGFTPTAGQSFDILDWGSRAGTFSSLNLPALTGLSWNTSELYTTGVLSVAEVAPTPFHDRVAASNPMLWYKLSESTGNAINSGSLGSTHDGVYNGSINRAAPTSGDDAGAGFNSTDDYIESLGASPLVGNPTFSIETLVFLPADGSADLWGPFLHWGDGGGPNNAPQRIGREVYFSVQNANLDRTYAGFYNAGLRTSSDVPLGEWLHIVWTREGGNSSAGGTTLYINGESVPLEQDPNLIPGFLTAAGINVNSTVFRINRAADFIGTRHFTGTMDEIALYDRVLSAAEVRDHACTIVGLCGIPGDFNDDGNVNAADYVVWRKGLGTIYTQDDFNTWRANFGATLGAGATATTTNDTVPEPSLLISFLLGLTTLRIFPRHRVVAKNHS